MKYKCIKDFNIEKYDDEWMPTGEYTIVSSGTIWEFNENTNNIGGEVHLDNVNMGWIEISIDTLKEYFEEVRE